MENNARSSLLQMAKGMIQERVDYEVERCIDNILDVNTEPTAKRKVTLTVELIPDFDRETIAISASAKSKLAPATTVDTILVMTSNGDGEVCFAEMLPQVPGQTSMDGSEQAAPKILRLANR